MKPKSKTVKERYDELRPVLKECCVELKREISRSVRSLKDPYLVRVRLAESRVKKLSSIRAKAKRDRIPPKEMIEKTGDLVGIRIVCSNLEDIARIRELLHGIDRLQILPDREDDRLGLPTEAGYRALHVGAEYSVERDGKKIVVPVEIQIRTMLQDSWAVLAHRDLYKEGAGLPEELKKLSRHLSDLLAAADGIAQHIREQVSRPTTVEQRPRSRQISKEGLAFIFKRAFGHPPADYLLQLVAITCQELGLKRLDALERMLMQPELREKVERVFMETAKEPLEDEALFELAPIILKRGIGAAEEITKERALELVESTRAHQRDLLSEFPRTYREFVESLQPVYKDDLCDFPFRIHWYAEALGVLRKCEICREPLVDEDEFEEAALEHYSIKDDSGRVGRAVASEADSGEVVGSALLCPYHADVLTKDD